MIKLNTLDHLRDVPNSLRIFGGVGDDDGGLFVIRSCEDKNPLGVIAAVGDGWDHVSVSRGDRTPTWAEMEQVKRLFFKPDETAMQLHVPVEQHISGAAKGGRCLNVLHIWRPHDVAIPMPPDWMVGPKDPT